MNISAADREPPGWPAFAPWVAPMMPIRTLQAMIYNCFFSSSVICYIPYGFDLLYYGSVTSTATVSSLVSGTTFPLIGTLLTDIDAVPVRIT